MIVEPKRLLPAAYLIVDDDLDAAEFLKFRLRQLNPDIGVEIRLQPDASGDFDMYFLDNDFAGMRLAAELAAAARRQRGDALIVAFSAFLDVQTLKQLINAGCGRRGV